MPISVPESSAVAHCKSSKNAGEITLLVIARQGQKRSSLLSKPLRCPYNAQHLILAALAAKQDYAGNFDVITCSNSRTKH